MGKAGGGRVFSGMVILGLTGVHPGWKTVAMRSVVLGLGISLDGYIARRDGSVDFLFMPKDYSMAPFFAGIDTAIMGRKTYDVAQAMGGGWYGPKMAVYVMSRNLPSGERNGYTFTSQTPEALVAHIRKSKGKDMW